MEDYNEYLEADRRYLEFKRQYGEHPEWFDFDTSYFAPQSPTRKKSSAWNGKAAIDTYQNMIDNYINNNSNN